MEKYAWAAALGALVPSIVLLHLSDKNMARALPTACNKVLDAEFFLTADTIHPYLKCMGEVGREMYLDFYHFDLVLFPLIYSVALYGALSRLWPTTSALSIIPFLAAMADIIENVCMCFLLTTFPARHPQLEAATSMLTRAKWTFGLISQIALIMGLVRRAVIPSKATQKSEKNE